MFAHLSRRIRMSYCSHSPAGIHRPSVRLPVRSSVCPSVHTFEQLLLWNFWANSFKRYVEPSVKEGLKICTNGRGPLIKMANIYVVRILKNLLLQNRKSFEAESWYTESGTQGLPNLFKWWSKVDLWPSFTTGSNLLPIHLYGERVENLFFFFFFFFFFFKIY